MSTRDLQLDQRLQALFRDLDAGPDFDARLMARLRAESQTEVAERVIRARQQEQDSHGRALSELQRWRRSMLRLSTVDILGMGLLLAIAAVTVWPHVNSQVWAGLRQYGPDIATSFGVLLAAVPLLGMWAERQAGRPG